MLLYIIGRGGGLFRLWLTSFMGGTFPCSFRLLAQHKLRNDHGDAHPHLLAAVRGPHLLRCWFAYKAVLIILVLIMLYAYWLWLIFPIFVVSFVYLHTWSNQVIKTSQCMCEFLSAINYLPYSQARLNAWLQTWFYMPIMYITVWCCLTICTSVCTPEKTFSRQWLEKFERY